MKAKPQTVKEYKAQQKKKTEYVITQLGLFLSGFFYLAAGLGTYLMLGMFLGFSYMEGIELSSKGALGFMAVAVGGLSALVLWVEMWTSASRKK